LAVIGNCVSVGVVVHPPFFLQALLLGPYLEIDPIEQQKGMLMQILQSVHVTARDKAFAESICPDSDKWWDDGRSCDLKDLLDLTVDKLEQVSISVIPLISSSSFFHSFV
jgi:hypothetical protein